MRIIIVFLLVFLSKQFYAQAPVKELLEQDWQICGPDFVGELKESGLNNSKSHVILSLSDQVVIVTYTYHNYGILRINENLKTKWNTPVTGQPIGIAKFNEKILIVHTDDMNKKDYYNQIYGTLIDPETGKKGESKILFKAIAGENNLREPKLFFSQDGTSFFLGVRYTEAENKTGILFGMSAARRFGEHYAKSSKFELLSFSENLVEVNRVSVPIKKNFSFEQVEMNLNNELVFLYSEGDKSFGVQKIDKNFSAEKSYKRFTVDLREKNRFEVNLYLSNTNPAITNCSVTYWNAEKEKTIDILRINMDEGTLKSASTVFDKPFRKEMKEQYKPFDKKADNLNTKEWEEMEIGNVFEYGENIISYAEVKYSKTNEAPPGSSGMTSHRIIGGDGVLSIYDKNLTLVDRQFIPRYIGYFGSDEIRSSIFAHNQVITLVSGFRTGNFSTLPYTVNYDLKLKKITKQEICERGGVKKSITLPIDPTSVLWFQNGFTISYQTGRGNMFAKAFRSHLLKFDY